MEISLDKVNSRSEPYQLFLDSVRSTSTLRRYKNLLHTFLKLIPNQIYTDNLGKTPKDRNVTTLARFFVNLARKDMDLASDVIATFIKEDKKRVETGEISSQTIPNHIKPIKVLLDANRVPIHWKSLNKLLPKSKEHNTFVPKSHEDIGANPVYIIHHFWHMHKEVENGYNWLGQIEKDDPEAKEIFNKLFDDIDKVWHYLEFKFEKLLTSQKQSDNFQDVIYELGENRRKDIAQEIVNHIQSEEFTIFKIKNPNNQNPNDEISINALEFVKDFLFENIKKSNIKKQNFDFTKYDKNKGIQ
ncbi:MAG: hypothetical protein KC444_00810 [Nitrosopumilus sp.]|nr:hypothetical protein [Nitrosopumilus sp.]